MVNKSIISIADKNILDVPIKENNDTLVDLRDFSDLVIDHRKSKDSESYFKLRNLVVKKLLEAKQYLPKGLKFLVVEGYRPRSLQKQYFDEYSKELKDSHPDWDQNLVYKEACKFVAPPEIIPPHSTGGAVDLTLIDENGKELNMGTPLNADPELSKGKCFTFSDEISEEAKNNRNILIEALSKVGFVNYETEWWHWSYGDRYWAYQKKQDSAIFGSVEQ